MAACRVWPGARHTRRRDARAPVKFEDSVPCRAIAGRASARSRSRRSPRPRCRSDALGRRRRRGRSGTPRRGSAWAGSSTGCRSTARPGSSRSSRFPPRCRPRALRRTRPGARPRPRGWGTARCATSLRPTARPAWLPGFRRYRTGHRLRCTPTARCRPHHRRGRRPERPAGLALAGCATPSRSSVPRASFQSPTCQRRPPWLCRQQGRCRTPGRGGQAAPRQAPGWAGFSRSCRSTARRAA